MISNALTVTLDPLKTLAERPLDALDDLDTPALDIFGTLTESSRYSCDPQTSLSILPEVSGRTASYYLDCLEHR